MSEKKVISGYKGFNPDFTCRDFQYEVGKEYETDKAVVCECGFHFCEFPLDVFSYYPPANNGQLSKYAKVDGSGIVFSDNTKTSCTHIAIKKEIDINELTKESVNYILCHIKNDIDLKIRTQSAATNTGDYSAATNTGYQSAATNTGNYSAATNTGTQSAATNTGNYSAATNTGDYSAATNTGDYSAATNTGNYSAATNTGDYSAATNTGDYSAATNTGDQSAATNTGTQSAATNTGNYSAATNTGYQSAATNTGDKSAAIVDGKESIAIVTGMGSKAKGKLGCWLVLTERDINYHIKCVKAFKVDGEKIKEDTFYTLIDGEPKECSYE